MSLAFCFYCRVESESMNVSVLLIQRKEIRAIVVLFLEKPVFYFMLKPSRYFLSKISYTGVQIQIQNHSI